MRQVDEDSYSFYVIQSKKDRKKFFLRFNDAGSIDLTTDLNEAYSESISSRLFFMLDEYRARFTKRFEVVRVDLKKVITMKVTNAKPELNDWLDGQRQIAKRIFTGQYA